MTQPEAKFKRDLVKAFEKLYPTGWCAYLRALGKNGVPDLRFVIPDRCGVWVEAKAEAKPYSSVQRLQMGRMRAAGDWVVGVRCYGLGDAQRTRRVLIESVDSRGNTAVAAETGWAALSDTSFWQSLLRSGALPC